jgi:hypothetical protein
MTGRQLRTISNKHNNINTMRLSALSIILLLILMPCFAALGQEQGQEGEAVWGFLDDDDAEGQASRAGVVRDAKPNWDGNTGVMWNGQPLRDTLEAFASHHHIGFLLDRRVDPGTPLTLDLKQATPRDVFEQAAAQCGLGFCELPTVAYLGPPDAAELLQLLVALRSEQLSQQLPKAKRDAMLSPHPFRAEPLDTPIETLQRLAGEIGFDSEAFAQSQHRLPHDVWPEIRFPNESPCTVFSLILIGFDRTLAVSRDATKLAAMPIPRALIVTRKYKGQVARQLAEMELLALAPDATITQFPQGISLEAPLVQLAKIEMRIAKRTAAINAETAKRHTPSNTAEDALTRLQHERFTAGNFSGSLNQTLKLLADRMQLELVIDEPSFAAQNVRIDTQITTSFNQATATEVFEKCLAPVGAKFRFEGNTVIVSME